MADANLDQKIEEETTRGRDVLIMTSSISGLDWDE